MIIPRPNRVGPTNSIRRFFDNNPDEELSLDDVTIKFDISRKQAVEIMCRLRSQGEITARYEKRQPIYRSNI